MTNERRQHARIAFHTPASLVFADRTVDVVVVDLSLKGALIRVPADTLIERDTICMLHVHLSEADLNHQINIEARVAHAEGCYLGLLCLTIDLDSVTHLRRLVELNLGDPELLERELSALVSE